MLQCNARGEANVVHIYFWSRRDSQRQWYKILVYIFVFAKHEKKEKGPVGITFVVFFLPNTLHNRYMYGYVLYFKFV